MSAHATMSLSPGAVQLVTSVRTRNLPPSKCGQLLVTGRCPRRLTTPVTTSLIGSKEAPPSVERRYWIELLPSLCQRMWSVPSADIEMSGANAYPVRVVPGGSAPFPFQVAPWSVERAKRRGDEAAHVT